MKRISMLSLVIAFLAAIMDIQGAGELHGPVTATVLGPTAVTVGSFTAAPDIARRCQYKPMSGRYYCMCYWHGWKAAPGAFCEVSR